MMKNTVVILMTALVMTGCHSSKPIAQAPQGVQAQLIQATPAVSTGMRFSAVVTPDAQVTLSFRVPGYVIALKQVRGQDGRMRDIAEGDRVTQGSVLARMRAVEYEDRVHQVQSQAEAAEAVAVKAKLDFERATRLLRTDSITKPEFDAARAQHDAAEAQVRAAKASTAEAQVSLRDTTLAVPFSGDIVKKNVEIGALVGPGVQTFAVANTDIVKIVVGVPDTVVRSIKVGQPVEVSIDAFPSRTFRARISRMSSAADTITRNFDVEIAIPNKDHLLKAGMIGSLQLAQGETQNPGSSLYVPLSAIVQAKDGKYGVFVVSKSSTGDVARMHGVEIGAVNGTDIKVVSGLSAGDRIITSGATLLKDGQRVEVVQ